MKRELGAIIAAAALLAASGCGGTANLQTEGKLVTTERVKTDTYDINLNYQGIVKAKDTKNYSFRMGGKVEEVFVTEGQSVRKGDKIAQLDAADIESSAEQSLINEAISANSLNKTESTYLTNITNAQINISTLQTALNAVDSNISAYKENIKAAEQGITALETVIATDDDQIAAAEESIAAFESKLESTRQTVDLAKINLERIEKLYEQGAVAKSELENIQVQYDDAESSYSQAVAQQSTNRVNLEQLRASHESNLANLESSRAQVKSMYAQLDTLGSQRAQTAAQISTANKELENLRNSMKNDVGSSAASEKINKLSTEQADRAVNYATLTAEDDGYVMLINIKAGEVTGAGTPVVIVKTRTKVVSIGVSLDDYGKLADVGDILINGETPGTIDNIDQYPDEGSRTYTVDIAFDNENLTMGEIVDVELVTAQGTGAFIPIESVLNIDGLDYIYIVNSDDTVSLTPIELGEVKDNTVRALNLTDEEIVISGMKPLKNNDKIIKAGERE